MTVKREFVKSVMDVTKTSLRISSDDLVLSGKVVLLFPFMNSRVVKVKKDKDSFCDDQSAKRQSKDGNCILLGDFNRHAESAINGYEGVHGGQGKKI